jgi:NADPH-dependent 2,4-dienoyl-CoA reductase/sulfur reductase-like enzyme
MLQRREAVELDAGARVVWDDRGQRHEYDRLLLATGSQARRLDAMGSSMSGVHYYRNLEDYLYLQREMPRFRHALVVGSGYVALELASVLLWNQKELTWLYPDEHPLPRVLPRDLGLYVAEQFRILGAEVISGESIASFEDVGGEMVARARSQNYVTTDIVLADHGTEAETQLAETAGLEVSSGIVVDEYARTSDPHVWAAGDVAEFPYLALDRRARVEYWDHAVHHGRVAGLNMAGAGQVYDHMPRFRSDVFDLNFEAIGETHPALTVETVWKEIYREGVIFYLRDEVVRGVLLWNSPGLTEWAREVIRQGRAMTIEERAKALAAAG